ncbi:RING-type domain-containing protein [Entamoeba marina]
MALSSSLQQLGYVLFNPYVFTPIVLLICLLCCVCVIKYSSLRDEDIMFIIFAIIICVLLKTSTISILDSYIPVVFQPVFLYAYFSIHLLRNMISLFNKKLREECYFAPHIFLTTFSGSGFIVFMPIIIILFVILVYTCVTVSPMSALSILLPEFMVLPVEVFQVYYLYFTTSIRCYDNQWNRYYISYFFTNLHLEIIVCIFILTHYLVLLQFSYQNKLLFLWISFQVLRMLIVLVFRIKTIKRYFLHIYLTSAIRACSSYDGDCSICFQPLKRGCISFPCNHCFHHSCVRPWLQRNVVCPMCKTEIIPKKINSEKYIQRLPWYSRFFVRLYQMFNREETINSDVEKVKETFPSIPSGVILKDLDRLGSANEVIGHYADNPDIVNHYNDETHFGDNDENLRYGEQEHNTDLQENEDICLGIYDEVEDEEEEEEINLSELRRLNELRKRELIEQNL